ncbi:putative hydrolases or acyltransferases (alpha/beta hydrolase superfamily), partial [Trachipleistophora hominis]
VINVLNCTPMHVNLSVYDESNHLLILSTTQTVNTEVIILYIGGMLSGLMHPKFVFEMADKMDFAQFAQPMLRSHPFFGLWSLSDDAKDIEKAITYICTSFQDKCNRSTTAEAENDINIERDKKPKIILLGHSTGCQSILHYLNTHKSFTKITCSILLGPVSDREYEEHTNPNLQHNLELAMENSKTTFLHSNCPVNAQRYISLFSKYGDDDLFSSDLSDEFFKTINKSGTPLHFLLLKDDEYVINSNADVLKMVNNADVRVIDGDHMLSGGVDGLISVLKEIIQIYC